MRIILTIFAIALTINGLAQGNRHVLLGDSLFKYSSYAKAITHYEKANKRQDRPELYIKLGNSQYRLNNYQEAVNMYKQAEKNPNAWTVTDQLNYIEALRSLGNKDEYVRLMNEWDDLPVEARERWEGSLLAEVLFYMDSSVYDVNEGWMNSDESDFSPSYSDEGIIFTSGRAKGNTSAKKFKWNNENYLDLYVASRKDKSPAIPFKVNTKYHDGPIVYFNRGSQVIFTRNNKTKNRTRELALYEADVDEQGKWKNIRELPFNDDNYSVSHPAINEEGNIIYFVSNMDGGYGGTDIYKSVRVAGEWQHPTNLGPDVNTEGNEMFPYFYNDELFFASNGHQGMGGLDIFIAEPLAGNTFLVRNLGYPINTPQDDFALITDDGKNGFLSSNRSGNDDIFEFIKDKIIVELNYVDEDRVFIDSVATILNGDTIYTRAGNKISHLYLDQNDAYELLSLHKDFVDSSYDIHTGEEFFMARTVALRKEILRGRVDIYPIAVNNTQTDFFLGFGEELIKADRDLEWKRNFELSKDGELTSLDSMAIRSLLESNGYEVVGHPQIERINFDFDKSDIRVSEHDKLARVAKLLNAYVATTVVIGAHTDARGSKAYNQRLSQRRADATKAYLVELGVDNARLTTVAYGETMLLISCDPCSEEEHQENRRVTFDVSIE